MEDSHIPTPEERRNMRMEQDTAGTSTNRVLRGVFAAIMVIVYIGMGVLLLINYFGWAGDWAWTRYVVGVMLIIYGGWRAYRHIAGIDSNI